MWDVVLGRFCGSLENRLLVIRGSSLGSTLEEASCTMSQNRRDYMFSFMVLEGYGFKRMTRAVNRSLDNDDFRKFLRAQAWKNLHHKKL